MHLLPGVAIQPNLELKTWPKLVLGSLPLAIALPAVSIKEWGEKIYAPRHLSDYLDGDKSQVF